MHRGGSSLGFGRSRFVLFSRHDMKSVLTWSRIDEESIDMLYDVSWWVGRDGIWLGVEKKNCEEARGGSLLVFICPQAPV